MLDEQYSIWIDLLSSAIAGNGKGEWLIDGLLEVEVRTASALQSAGFSRTVTPYCILTVGRQQEATHTVSELNSLFVWDYNCKLFAFCIESIGILNF